MANRKYNKKVNKHTTRTMTVTGILLDRNGKPIKRNQWGYKRYYHND